jgi:hypothetical protein
MSRWICLVPVLLTACEQAHWECVDAGGAVLEAGDVTCDDFAADGEQAWADAQKDCADEGCTCRFVTSACSTDDEE